MIAISVKLIPGEVLSDCRLKAKENNRVSKKIGIYSAIVIILLWIAVFAFILSKLKN